MRLLAKSETKSLSLIALRVRTADRLQTDLCRKERSIIVRDPSGAKIECTVNIELPRGGRRFTVALRRFPPEHQSALPHQERFAGSGKCDGIFNPAEVLSQIK